MRSNRVFDGPVVFVRRIADEMKYRVGSRRPVVHRVAVDRRVAGMDRRGQNDETQRKQMRPPRNLTDATQETGTSGTRGHGGSLQTMEGSGRGVRRRGFIGPGARENPSLKIATVGGSHNLAASIQ